MKKLDLWCFQIILFFSAANIMSGCGILDDGRMAAWENVRMKEEETKQKLLEVREKELAGAFSAGEDIPLLTVTTLDSNGQPVEVSMNILPMIKTIIAAVDRDRTYGLKLSESKQPTGQAGESLQATTGLIKAVGSSPAALVLMTGEVMAKGIDAAGERMRADTINIDSNNSAPKTNIATTNNAEAAETAVAEAAEKAVADAAEKAAADQAAIEKAVAEALEKNKTSE
ncbi:MAG: hypothetical protein Q3M24_23035 [Candidatus Electrothrix aestuarii]|uniref:Lipoprotein n=1 Tax=Candidatus Electrothrix aestuarii TaxID=3062594 RepID=A0AAU8LW40_9BACT|nr:hypothetical protein [Candidatus Electrothrix aestuarii]WPD22072.1 MAG: hypothetical protein SD837_17935 [Candidatus Electrothrix sp. GW3-3]